MAAGFGKAMIDSRLRSGVLTRVSRGVYAIGPASYRGLEREVEALLLTAAPAALSHLTAARLWRIHRRAEDRHVDLMVGLNSIRRHPRLRVHRSGALPELAPAYVYNLPVAPVALTLVQIAAWLDAWELERAIDEALARRLLTLDYLSRTARQHQHHAGTNMFRELIDARIDGAGVSKRGVEHELLKLIREAGLPEPQRNVQLGTFSADFYWPEVKVAVEAQSYTWHTVRTNYERDGRKEIAFKRAGIDLIHLTWDAVTRRQIQTSALLAKLLAHATWPTV